MKAGFVSTAGVIQHVRDGKLKGLAISASARTPLAPDVPTTYGDDVAEAVRPDPERCEEDVLGAGAPEELDHLGLVGARGLGRRFPAVEGRLYLVGGFAATYLRRGNIVLIPIRLGVGYRAGVNVGYMKITHKAKWLPF